MTNSFCKYSIFILLISLFGCGTAHDGFYKDVFIDGGVGLSDIADLPAVNSLGLSYESIANEDSVIQAQLIIGNELDENGILLYPDNEPRFKILYTNGGSSRMHGYSLNEAGRERIRTFNSNGGGYVGSCAGSALASLGRDSAGHIDEYYHLWPGYISRIKIGPVFTNHLIPENSEILKYRDFSGERSLSGIRFFFGNFADNDIQKFPAGTEILLIYETPLFEMDKRVSSWAYKKSDNAGRIAVVGCHPEFYERGKNLQLMEALFLYALDGLGNPQLKGELINGEKRIMNKTTGDNDPGYTKIGDLQYHHFKINLPLKTKKIIISLESEGKYDLHLFANKNNFAFDNNADFSETASGNEKKIVISNAGQGEWFVSVFCASEVDSENNGSYSIYTDNLELLNGTPYVIKANWEEL